MSEQEKFFKFMREVSEVFLVAFAIGVVGVLIGGAVLLMAL